MRTETPWPRIVLIYTAGVLGAVQTGLLAPLIPLLQHDLGLTLPFVSAALSAITAISAVFGTVAGGWMMRLGAARTVQIGVGMMAAVAVLTALTRDGIELMAARVVLGVGYLAVVVAGPPLIARLAAPQDRSFALALWGAFVPVGIAIGEGVVAVGLDGLGWRGLFWADAIVLAFATLASWRWLRDPPHDPESAPIAPVWHVYVERGPMLLMLAFAVFAFTFIVYAGIEPTFLAEARGLPTGTAARIVALTSLFGIPGTVVAGWLIKRGVSARPLAIVSLIVPALAATLVFLPDLSIPAVTVATTVAFLLGGMMPAATFALIPVIAPEPHRFAAVIGLLTQLGSAGTLIGAPLFAVWIDTAGWDWGAAPMLVIAALGTLCVLGLSGVSSRSASMD